jgi:hypothetical protein
VGAAVKQRSVEKVAGDDKLDGNYANDGEARELLDYLPDVSMFSMLART